MKGKSNVSDRYTIMAAFSAAAAIMIFAASAVVAVQAYLTASTNTVDNEFAPMTYTNTEITETGGDKDNNFTLTGSEANTNWTITKAAKVNNPAGGDRKPVFVRTTFTLSVYDGDVNVSSYYPCTVNDLSLNDDWVKNSADGYYYYKKVLVPGEVTSDLFNGNGVVFKPTVPLPDGLVVKVDVIADTVQAVSTDTSKWTGADYSTTEVVQAWGVTPSFNGSLPEGKTSVGVTWSF